MPTYEHQETGERALTVPGSVEDRRLMAASAWVPVDNPTKTPAQPPQQKPFADSGVTIGKRGEGVTSGGENQR